MVIVGSPSVRTKTTLLQFLFQNGGSGQPNSFFDSLELEEIDEGNVKSSSYTSFKGCGNPSEITRSRA
ncbi:hypothetical protein QJS10_CPA06g02205 [Acorus calamus]|uniref:Uncharacterized protein n=1 Tax=Acorus calamus TaxID=4465 RepID=A0AAV9EIK2_ACOCL|nr:hypothetical protein QJS10_CPA06g02205 [Acorus calamus]